MLDYSLFRPAEVPVKGPNGKDYVLRSANAGAGIAYEAAQFAARRPADPAAADEGKPATPPPPDWNGILSAELILISACLADADGDGVPPAVLRKEWPHAARTEMYRWVIANSPELSSRTRDSLLREREMIDKQLADVERGASDPKDLPASGGASST